MLGNRGEFLRDWLVQACPRCSHHGTRRQRDDVAAGPVAVERGELSVWSETNQTLATVGWAPRLRRLARG
jgi:hypothetical protein